MNVTIDIKTLFIVLVLIALIVLIVFAIIAVKKLFTTIDSTNRILADTEEMMDIYTEWTKDADVLVKEVTETVSGIAAAAKGNEKTISAIAGIMKSAASIKGMMSKDKDKSQ